MNTFMKTLRLEFAKATQGIQQAEQERTKHADRRALLVLMMHEQGFSSTELGRILGFDESRARTLIERGKKFRLEQAKHIQKDEQVSL